MAFITLTDKATVGCFRHNGANIALMPATTLALGQKCCKVIGPRTGRRQALLIVRRPI